MRKTIAIVLWSLVLMLVASNVSSQEKPPAQTDKALAQAMTNSIKRTGSLEVFGENVRQQILDAAAKEIAKGNLSPTVDVKFTVRVIRGVPSLPRVPSPAEVNVCWEMCSSLRCYIECSAPSIPGVGP
jgi:hypothetical protein